MSEIDHADDAKNHRVADGDEFVDRPQREPIDELLQEIIHAPTYPLVSPRFAGNVPFVRGRPVVPARSIRRRSRAGAIARPRLCNVAGAGAHGNPTAGTFPAMLWIAKRAVMLYCFAQYLLEYFGWRAKSPAGITIREQRHRVILGARAGRRLDISRALRNAGDIPPLISNAHRISRVVREGNIHGNDDDGRSDFARRKTESLGPAERPRGAQVRNSRMPIVGEDRRERLRRGGQNEESDRSPPRSRAKWSSPTSSRSKATPSRAKAKAASRVSPKAAQRCRSPMRRRRHAAPLRRRSNGRRQDRPAWLASDRRRRQEFG